MASKILSVKRKRCEVDDESVEEAFYVLNLTLNFEGSSTAPVIEPLYFNHLIVQQLQTLYGIYGAALNFEILEYEKETLTASIKILEKHRIHDKGIRKEVIAMVAPPPFIEGMARRWFLRHVATSIGLGILFAEGYYRLDCLPRQQKRDKYYADRGVTYQKPF